MNYLFPLTAILIWAGNTVVTKMSAGAIHPAEGAAISSQWPPETGTAAITGSPSATVTLPVSTCCPWASMW